MGQTEKRGGGLGDPIADVEEVTEPWMNFYVDAFFDLCSARPVGMGLSPIPWDQIRQYAIDHGYVGNEIIVFKMIMRKMDGHYLKENKGRGDGQK